MLGLGVDVVQAVQESAFKDLLNCSVQLIVIELLIIYQSLQKFVYLAVILVPQLLVRHQLHSSLVLDFLGAFDCDLAAQVVSGDLRRQGHVSHINTLLEQRMFSLLCEGLPDDGLRRGRLVEPETHLVSEPVIKILRWQKSVLHHVDLDRLCHWVQVEVALHL